jgi:N-hydroxyarylamine O-acetyltransferase
MTQTVPLRLESGIEQLTSHEPFRLVWGEPDYIVQALIRGVWTPLYRLSLDICYPCDYELANYYVSTHPKSTFFNLLQVTRPASGCRFKLTGPEFFIYTQDRGTERRPVQSVTELRMLLTDVFLIHLPETPELDPILERTIAGRPL